MNNVRCVFGLSTGRTGTVTLVRLLELSPSLCPKHEPKPDLYTEAARAYTENTDLGPQIFQDRKQAVETANKSGRLYVDVTPHISLLPDSILSAFPGADFIHIHRHPYEVIRSGMRRGWYISVLSQPRPRQGDQVFARWASLKQIEKIAWKWARFNERALQFFSELESGRKFTLTFQELIKGDLEKLFLFLRSPVPSREKIKDVLRKRWNKQEIGSFDWSDKERKLVRPFLSSVSARLGYEL